MTRQTQTTENKSDKKKEPKVGPPEGKDASNNLAGLAQLPSGPIASACDGAFRAQATLPNNSRPQTIQRRTLAIRIGRVHGNQYLQKRIVALKVNSNSRSLATNVQRESDISNVGASHPPRVYGYRRATGIANYITLVRALEQLYSRFTSRQILALLRQVYYGRPWSAVSTRQWQDVLPHSPAMPDPRDRAGRGRTSLFEALRQSQEVDGTDVGHVLTGLEALLNPTRQVEIEVPGPNVVVNMPNAEFATWGGDLGSAAGQAVADRYLGRRVRQDIDYFQKFAPDADLEGDIDAFAIQSGATRSGGLAATLGAAGGLDNSVPVSRILEQYYLAISSHLGMARTNRYHNFVTRIGGRVSGSSIANRSALLWPIAMRVKSFAFAWYMKEYRDALNIFSALTTTGPGLNTHLRIKSLAMTKFFLNWLEDGRL